MSDQQLERWRNEWIQLGASGNAEELVRRASNDRRRLRLSAAGEVFGAACSTAIVGWLLVRTHGAIETVAIAALILSFNGAWLTQYFGMRRSALSASAASVRECVELTRERLHVEQRWNDVARRWTLLLVLLVVPWIVWIIVARFDMYRAEPWRAYVGLSGVVVILAGLFAFMQRKRRRLRSELEAFERQVQALDL